MFTVDGIEYERHIGHTHIRAMFSIKEDDHDGVCDDWCTVGGARMRCSREINERIWLRHGQLVLCGSPLEDSFAHLEKFGHDIIACAYGKSNCSEHESSLRWVKEFGK